jgi:hypothetical protein
MEDGEQKWMLQQEDGSEQEEDKLTVVVGALLAFFTSLPRFSGGSRFPSAPPTLVQPHQGR